MIAYLSLSVCLALSATVSGAADTLPAPVPAPVPVPTTATTPPVPLAPVPAPAPVPVPVPVPAETEVTSLPKIIEYYSEDASGPVRAHFFLDIQQTWHNSSRVYFEDKAYTRLQKDICDSLGLKAGGQCYISRFIAPAPVPENTRVGVFINSTTAEGANFSAYTIKHALRMLTSSERWARRYGSANVTGEPKIGQLDCKDCAADAVPAADVHALCRPYVQQMFGRGARMKLGMPMTEQLRNAFGTIEAGTADSFGPTCVSQLVAIACAAVYAPCNANAPLRLCHSTCEMLDEVCAAEALALIRNYPGFDLAAALNCNSQTFEQDAQKVCFDPWDSQWVSSTDCKPKAPSGLATQVVNGKTPIRAIVTLNITGEYVTSQHEMLAPGLRVSLVQDLMAVFPGVKPDAFIVAPLASNTSYNSTLIDVVFDRVAAPGAKNVTLRNIMASLERAVASTHWVELYGRTALNTTGHADRELNCTDCGQAVGMSDVHPACADYVKATFRLGARFHNSVTTDQVTAMDALLKRLRMVAPDCGDFMTSLICSNVYRPCHAGAALKPCASGCVAQSSFCSADDIAALRESVAVLPAAKIANCADTTTYVQLANEATTPCFNHLDTEWVASSVCKSSAPPVLVKKPVETNPTVVHMCGCDNGGILGCSFTSEAGLVPISPRECVSIPVGVCVAAPWCTGAQKLYVKYTGTAVAGTASVSINASCLGDMMQPLTDTCSSGTRLVQGGYSRRDVKLAFKAYLDAAQRTAVETAVADKLKESDAASTANITYAWATSALRATVDTNLTVTMIAPNDVASSSNGAPVGAAAIDQLGGVLLDAVQTDVEFRQIVAAAAGGVEFQEEVVVVNPPVAGDDDGSGNAWWIILIIVVVVIIVAIIIIALIVFLVMGKGKSNEAPKVKSAVYDEEDGYAGRK